MKKFIKGFVFAIVIIVLLIIFAILLYFTYVQANSSEAKEYLIDKYEINKKDLFAIKYTEYIYEDIADCSSLWIKKCSDDPNLLYKYTFKFKDNNINVYEDNEGNFTDNYEEK